MNRKRIAHQLRQLASDVAEYSHELSGDLVGEVYFVQEGEDGPVKIGFTSSHIARRIYTLQSGNPRSLRLIGRFPAVPMVETRLHGMFSRTRIRGEWFEPSQELLVLAETADRVREANEP